MGKPCIIRKAESRVFMRLRKLAYMDKCGVKKVVNVFTSSMDNAAKVVKSKSDFGRMIRTDTVLL